MIGRLVASVALVVLATGGLAAAQGTAPAAAQTTPAVQTTPATAHDAAITAAKKPALTPEELATANLTVNNQTAVMCNVCFTCGGDWPIYAGTLPTASAANERGSSCSGDFSMAFNDTLPFLCCR
jgi:hypothetical protein